MSEKRVLAIITAVLTGLAMGGGGATFSDVTGARAYKEGLAERISHTAELERRVYELEAQNRQLLEMLNGATLRPDLTVDP